MLYRKHQHNVPCYPLSMFAQPWHSIILLAVPPNQRVLKRSKIFRVASRNLFLYPVPLKTHDSQTLKISRKAKTPWEQRLKRSKILLRTLTARWKLDLVVVWIDDIYLLFGKARFSAMTELSFLSATCRVAVFSAAFIRPEELRNLGASCRKK